MKGNCGHVVRVVKPNDGLQPDLGIDRPAVQVFNDNDQFYHEIFETQIELDEFIQRLRNAGREAFGS